MLALIAINCFIVATTVIIHYESLFYLSNLLKTIKVRHRSKILIGVFGALIAHVIEIWVFTIAYYLMHHSEDWGKLSGNFDGSLLDCSYFSFTTFTTLGFGDIEAVGYIKHLTGVESLTGLVLITWTASFLFIEMQRYWGER